MLCKENRVLLLQFSCLSSDLGLRKPKPIKAKPKSNFFCNLHTVSSSTSRTNRTPKTVAGTTATIALLRHVQATTAAYQAQRPSASKLLVVWHATSRKVAQNCSDDTAQFLEGDSYTLLLSLVVLAVTVLLPLNLSAGTAVLDNNFSRTTISSRKASLYSGFTSSSPLSWRFWSTSGICHQAFEDYKVQDGYGNLNDPTSYSTGIRCLMNSLNEMRKT